MSFITKEWLEDILCEEVEDFTIDSGSNPKDGYCGALFAVHVQFKLQSKKEIPEFILIKTLAEDLETQKWLCKNNILHKEFLVYSSLRTELVTFQKDLTEEIIKLPLPQFINGAAVDFSRIPESEWENYATPQLNFIVMPDLRKTGGFKMTNRTHGADFSHCTLIFDALAKFHAISWAYKQTKDLQNVYEKFPFLKSTLFDNMSDAVMDSLFDHKFDGLRRIVKTKMSDEDQDKLEILNSLERSRNVISDVAVLYFSHVKTTSHPLTNKNNILRVPMPSSFMGSEEPCWTTACHGDSWLNNFIFSYDDHGKVEQVVMLDFQLTFEGDPMSDLTYFLYSNTTYEFRKNNLSALLNVYADSFTKVCNHLNVAPLPDFGICELTRRFHRAKLCGFFGASLNLALFLETQTSKDNDGSNPLLEKMVIELAKELYEEGVI